MDYFLTEEQKMIRDLARQIADEKVRPVAAEYDEKEEFPWPILKVIAESDLFGIFIEEKYGGTGDPSYFLQFYESPDGKSYTFFKFVRTSYHEPNWYWNNNGIWLCTGLSVGTHTFKVRWITNQGTVYQNGLVVRRHFIATKLK